MPPDRIIPSNEDPEKSSNIKYIIVRYLNPMLKITSSKIYFRKNYLHYYTAMTFMDPGDR